MLKSAVRSFLKRHGYGFRLMREEAKLTQLEVARRMGCSQAIISHIEQGFFLPSESFEEELNNLYSSLIFRRNK